MLKPIGILALDAASAAFAAAAEKAVERRTGIRDLVQVRALAPSGYTADVASIPADGAATLPPENDLAAALMSIQERWQAPDSAVRSLEARRPSSARSKSVELVLIMLSSAGPGREIAIELARQVRRLYLTLLGNHTCTCELLCLLPDLFDAPGAGEYASTYSFLKLLSHVNGSATDGKRLLDYVWLMASGNDSRIKFGKLRENQTFYAEALAGFLTHEAEMSGPAPGTFRPRGVDATFSAFGYAHLVFPRATLMTRLESNLAGDLIERELLANDVNASPAVAQSLAKKLVGSDEFTSRANRLDVVSGQSVSREFQPKVDITNAEEIITALGRARKAYNDKDLVEKQRLLAEHADQTRTELIEILSRNVDDHADQKNFATSERFLEALIDPFPNVNWSSAARPARNLMTELATAQEALDKRIDVEPNVTETNAKQKRIEELRALLSDQKLATETIAAAHHREEDAMEDSQVRSIDPEEAQKQRADAIAASEKELSDIRASLSAAKFAEDQENSVLRTSGKETMRARLAKETASQEGSLRELFAERPQAVASLREALRLKKAFLDKHIKLRPGAFLAIVIALLILGKAMNFAPANAFLAWLGSDLLRTALIVLAMAAIYGAVIWLKYVAEIAATVREAREWNQRLEREIPAARDRIQAAHAEELQFEYDVSLRETKVKVLRRLQQEAKKQLENLRRRMQELEALRREFSIAHAAATIQGSDVNIPIVVDAEVDGYYVQTAGERETAVRDFLRAGLKRSAARVQPIGAVRQRVESYAAEAFASLRQSTLSQVLTGSPRIASDAELTRRLIRFADFGSPLIELGEVDTPAEDAMQRDTTFWIDRDEGPVSGLLRNRFGMAEIKAGGDALNAYVISRALHFPAYVMGQIWYYRAQYMAAPDPQTAALPDLMPMEYVLTGAVRAAYERLFIADVLGVVQKRADGKLTMGSQPDPIGESYEAAAHRLASADGELLRGEMERAIGPRFAVNDSMVASLRALHDRRDLTALDKQVIDGLVRQFSALV
jgi:hypothetical protein